MPKKTFGGPPLSGAQLASDLVFVGAKMTPFLSPECLFYQRFLHILVIFGCPQRSAAPGPAAASDLVFVGPQNDPILSPKCLFYQRFLHILVIFGAPQRPDGAQWPNVRNRNMCTYRFVFFRRQKKRSQMQSDFSGFLISLFKMDRKPQARP